MIKLRRLEKPSSLTDEFVAKETDRYKESVKNKKPISVWNVDWLKDSLLESSFHKCAYCECQVNIEGSYMEVEHFKDKSDYPDDVLNWENLLPSCKRCNVNKSDHDVIEEPIINPYEDIPSDHLYMLNYFIKGKTEKGKSTIKVLDLNDISRLCSKRFEIGSTLQTKIQELPTLIKDYEDAKTNGKKNAKTFRRNKLTGMMRDILTLCQPEKEYAATCSTIVLNDNDFILVIEYLKAESLWDKDLESLYYECQKCALLI